MGTIPPGASLGLLDEGLFEVCVGMCVAPQLYTYIAPPCPRLGSTYVSVPEKLSLLHLAVIVEIILIAHTCLELLHTSQMTLRTVP